MVIVFYTCDKQFNFGTEHKHGFNLSPINKMFYLNFCSTYDMNVQTGWEMYGVEKRREGICPGGKNDKRENVWGGNMTRGNMSWLKKRLEEICPRCQK